MREGRTLGGIALAVVLLAAAAAGAPLRAPPLLYSPTSPLNTPIPASPRIDPGSAEYVAVIADLAEENGGLVVAVKRWTTPVYYANRKTPRWDVRLTASWAPRRRLLDVPIPRRARPDPADDGHMTVIDRKAGCEFDFYEASRGPDGSWSAAWANRIELADDGIYDRGLSARGSGFALAAGLIRPAELRAGIIQHALAFSYGFTREGGPVSPATESDGDSLAPYALPQGARLQLDPAFDVSALAAPWQRTIARALQRYGMFLVDDGSNTGGLFAVNPMSWSRNPYPWGDDDYAYLPAELTRRLRVLTLPRQIEDRPRVLASRCASYR